MGEPNDKEVEADVDVDVGRRGVVGDEVEEEDAAGKDI